MGASVPPPDGATPRDGPPIDAAGAPADGTLADAARDAGALDVVPTVDITPFDGGPDAASMPPPFDAAAGDSAGDACALLADAYLAAVRAAQRCSLATDCATLVCETLCCSCQVYTSATAAELDVLMRLQSSWRAAGCSARVTCPTTPCDPAVVAECSSTGRCTTIRRPGGSG